MTPEAEVDKRRFWRGDGWRPDGYRYMGAVCELCPGTMGILWSLEPEGPDARLRAAGWREWGRGWLCPNHAGGPSG